MRILREMTVIIELTGDDLELFKVALKKVQKSEDYPKPETLVLTEDERLLIETILSAIKS